MPKTLLLADDSVVIQKLVGLSFANEDIKLVTTDNGDDALTRAREVGPDLVLADVVMPGKNGYEVCAAIKSDPQLSHVPVLLLTGTFEAFDDERARQVGSDGHITKPFEAQGLVDRVSELLARAAQAAPAPAAPAAPSPAAAPAAAPQAPPSAAPAAPIPPPPSSDDAFDFFDDGAHQLGTDEPTLATAAPTVPSRSAGATDTTDPLSSLADDPLAIDGLGDSGILDDSFGLEPSGPDDLTRAVMPPAPPPEPAGAPPLAQDPGATRVAFDDDLLGDDTMSAGQRSSPWQGETAATPNAAPDPVLGDDLFGESPAAAAVAAQPAPAPAAAPAPTDVPVTTSAGRAAGARVDVAGPPPALGSDPLEGAAIPGAPTAPVGGKFDFDVSMSDLGGPLAAESPRPAAGSPPSPTTATDLSPEMRDRIHETLEKVAWEAFADLSDTIVRQVIQRVESVVWDIVPQMAETLIQEEIRRIKGGE